MAKHLVSCGAGAKGGKLLEISLVYQDKETRLTCPGTKYGSNLGEFTDMLAIALEGIGLRLDGHILELSNE